MVFLSWCSFFFLIETEAFTIKSSLDNEKDDLQKSEKFEAVM